MVLWACGWPVAFFLAVELAVSLVDVDALGLGGAGPDAYDYIDGRAVVVGVLVCMAVWTVLLVVVTRLVEVLLRRHEDRVEDGPLPQSSSRSKASGSSPVT